MIRNSLLLTYLTDIALDNIKKRQKVINRKLNLLLKKKYAIINK